MYNNLSVWFLVVGVLILASNFIDVPYIISRLFSRAKVKVETIETEKKEEGFLEIVSLWYQLKSKCDQYDLKVASDKLDEVFPLLNKIIEEDTDAKVS
jgi:hypothetical protein